MPENEIIISTKINNSGIEKGTNTINKALGKVDNSLSKTSKKITETFAGTSGAKIDSLTSKIERQEVAIEKETIKLSRLNDEYNKIINKEITPKSLLALEKEFKNVEKEYLDLTNRSAELFRELEAEKSFDLEIRDTNEIKILEAQISSLDEKILTAGERADFLSSKISEIKLHPETSIEAQKLRDNIGLTDTNVSRLKNELSKAKEQLDRTFGKDSNKRVKDVSSAMSSSHNALQKFGDRLKRIAIGALLFNAISKGLSDLRRYMMGLLMSNKQFSESLNQVKTSLATAFQPIYEAILPALTTFMNWLTKGITYIAYFINSLFGKTLSQSKKNASALNKQAEAIKGVGSSAKKAEKSLASFDKVNILQSNKDSSGGGGESTGLGNIIGKTKLPDINTDIFDKVKSVMGTALSWMQETFGPSWSKFWNDLQPNIETFKENSMKLFEGVEPIFERFISFVKTKFVPDFVKAVDIFGKIFNGLFDSANLVFGELIDSYLLPWANTMVDTVIPTVEDFGITAWESFGVLFENIKEIFDEVFVEGIIPVLDLLMTIWSGLWDSIKKFWDKWGKPIFDELNKTIGIIKTNFLLFWNTTLKPVLDTIIGVLKELWVKHLKPLLDNVLDMIGELVQGALEIYNKFFSPIIQFLIKTFGPIFASVFGAIAKTVGGVIGGIIDAISGVITVIKGIIQFIVGVFTGDWERAWKGIKNVFKGIWDGLLALIKIPLNLMIDGINSFIKAVNKIKLPDWDILGKYAGKGFNLTLIPKLAEGAIIPPNKEFMAVLGDQKSGMNIETPEGLLRKIFREEIGGNTDKPMVVKVYVGDEEIYSKFEKYTDNKNFALNGGR